MTDNRFEYQAEIRADELHDRLIDLSLKCFKAIDRVKHNGGIMVIASALGGGVAAGIINKALLGDKAPVTASAIGGCLLGASVGSVLADEYTNKHKDNVHEYEELYDRCGELQKKVDNFRYCGCLDPYDVVHGRGRLEFYYAKGSKEYESCVNDLKKQVVHLEAIFNAI